MIKIKHCIPILIIFAFSSCDFIESDCIRGNGNMEHEIRNVHDFSQLRLNGFFDVYIEKDTVFSLEIMADENLIPYIDSYERNDQLIIETRPGTCIKTRNAIEVYVFSPEVNSIELWGSGKVTCDTFINNGMYVGLFGSGHISFASETQDLEIVHEGSGSIHGFATAKSVNSRLLGSGSIKLKGNAALGDFQLDGSGEVNCFELNLDTCFARNTGSGSIKVHANDYLDAQVYGSGSIYYQGSPDTIISDDFGPGRIIKRN